MEQIQAAREENSGATSTLLLIDCFESNWSRLVEASKTNKSLKTCDNFRDRLWRIREPLSFELFYRKFFLNSTNGRRYPVINSVLENETILPCLKYIADILAWHSFLFSILPATTTRDQVFVFNFVMIFLGSNLDSERGYSIIRP